jgi:hypothetical protein
MIDADGEAFAIQKKMFSKRIQQISRTISEVITLHQEEVMASVRAASRQKYYSRCC